jgi:hypothetical protein
VRTQISRIGRRRKVIKPSKAPLSFIGKAVTASAGKTAVSRAFDAFGTRAQLDARFDSFDGQNQHPPSVIFRSIAIAPKRCHRAIASLINRIVFKQNAVWGQYFSICHKDRGSTLMCRLRASTTLPGLRVAEPLASV